MIHTPTRSPAFERTSKRRKGFPSETRVKRGLRSVKGGAVELLEKLGRNDPCPCGSRRRFQGLLPQERPLRRGRAARLLAVRVGRAGQHCRSWGHNARHRTGVDLYRPSTFVRDFAGMMDWIAAHPIKLGLLALVVAVWLYRRSGPTAGVAFDRDDPRLLAAKAEARVALPRFWTALEQRQAGDEDFALKFNLNHGSAGPDAESIWAGDIVRRDGKLFGRLANAPLNPNYRAGDEVEIAPEAIDDWSFFRGDVAQGHFVTRVMLDAAPPRVAARQRAQLGWTAA